MVRLKGSSLGKKRSAADIEEENGSQTNQVTLVTIVTGKYTCTD